MFDMTSAASTTNKSELLYTTLVRNLQLHHGCATKHALLVMGTLLINGKKRMIPVTPQHCCNERRDVVQCVSELGWTMNDLHQRKKPFLGVVHTSGGV